MDVAVETAAGGEFVSLAMTCEVEEDAAVDFREGADVTAVDEVAGKLDVSMMIPLDAVPEATIVLWPMVCEVRVVTATFGQRLVTRFPPSDTAMIELSSTLPAVPAHDF